MRENRDRNAHVWCYKLLISKKKLKPTQNKKGRNFFLAAPKMVSFLQLAAEKKTPFLVLLEKFPVTTTIRGNEDI
jgi:hypothetical protein